jgi:molybdate transport system substrate-binding protein
VFAAASLSDAFAEIARAVERDHPGAAVRLNLAGSNQLALQIEHGAPAAVFASADPVWTDRLRERGLLEGQPRVFARNRLVVVVSRAGPARIERLQDLARSGVRLVMAAAAVPAGRYGRQVLHRLSENPAFGPDYARRALANVVSEEDNVRSVVAKVQLGEADAGLAYRSDVTAAAARHVRVLGFPDPAKVLAAYPIAIVKGARHRELAETFVRRVLAEEGQRILGRHGFLPGPQEVSPAER